MSKNITRKELMRYVNFIVDGICEKNGHMSFIEIRSSSNNWRMRVDESTFMFGLLKDTSKRDPEKQEIKMRNEYIHSLIAILYRFGTSVMPVDFLVEFNKLMIEYQKNHGGDAPTITDEEEQKILSDMKREYEIKEELKKYEKDGK